MVSSLFMGQAGCAPRQQDAVSRDEIVVAAAANLIEAFDEIGKRFTAKTGVRVVNSFGSTTDLAKQIEHGAPFDVFAAADIKHVESLEQKGLLADNSRAVYARGRLVLWLPRGVEAGVESLTDLTGANVSRIAMAKPELAPYGEAAVEALRALNIWASIEQKVVYAQNVAQAKQFAATGNADAAFIPRSLLKSAEGKVIEQGAVIEISGEHHRPLDQALGIVRESKKQEAARKFVDFVLSDEGQTLLESYGYEKAKNQGGRPH